MIFKIDKLEVDGYIKKIGDFMKDDRILESKMKDAHANYFYLRKSIYRYFLGEVSSIEDNQNALNTGIGRIREIENLDCLHIHHSHGRVCENNVAGLATYHLLNKEITCKEGLCDNAHR